MVKFKFFVDKDDLRRSFNKIRDKKLFKSLTELDMQKYAKNGIEI